MIEAFKKKNPEYKISEIHDQCFQTYGRILEADTKDVRTYAQSFLSLPESSFYQPRVAEIEAFDSIKDLSHKVYGYLDVMAGIVAGHNQIQNGLEYHQCSETIIAITDYVLGVGHRYEMIDDTYQSEELELFYVPEGTCIELYATTLHYTPMAVSSRGFMTICLLLTGTGDILPHGKEGILKKKNKWFIAHQENLEKVREGDFPGLLGKMIRMTVE